MAAQICETCKNKGKRCYCPPNSTCGGYEPKDTYRPSNCDIPMPQGFGEQKGWICPVCGRGLAPWVDFCPCQGSEMKITYGTGLDNNVDLSIYQDTLDNINRALEADEIETKDLLEGLG